MSGEQSEAEWQARLAEDTRRTETERRMQEEETAFIRNIRDEIAGAKDYAAFQVLVEKYSKDAAPTTTATVRFKSKEVTFPEGTFNVVVSAIPRRDFEHAADPITYNIFVIPSSA